MLFEPYRNEPFADFTDAATLAGFQRALAAVKGQLGRDYPLTIGGKQLVTGSYLDSYDPSRKERLVGRAAKAGPREIELAMDAA